MPARVIATVKVDLVLGSVAEIYDRDRKHVQQRKLDEAESRMIHNRRRAFCAAWWSDATGWVLLNRTISEGW
jgi:hypothetical protein